MRLSISFTIRVIEKSFQILEMKLDEQLATKETK